MSVIFLLITCSTVVALVFLGAFVWAVRKGQYDDDRSPAVRMLHDLPPQVDPKTTAE
ncbi:MAG: cbb3-type cytochrome oxidase assembly protein CcoS [Flavobacteriales bacterium]|nr:cbb3-type cytochrome oxidase assembly protein CcoS [Flavobacteriales bacterium]MBK9534763.1 cbb3-type cytochrome oxidase assembly protein CcoS [Flavobacteriales bacterium]